MWPSLISNFMRFKLRNRGLCEGRYTDGVFLNRLILITYLVEFAYESHVDGGPSGGSRVHRPGSEDPIGMSGNCILTFSKFNNGNFAIIVLSDLSSSISF